MLGGEFSGHPFPYSDLSMKVWFNNIPSGKILDTEQRPNINTAAMNRDMHSANHVTFVLQKN